MRNHLTTVILACLTLLFSACGSLVHYKVQQGDSLYSIGWRYGQDVKQLAAWNNLEAPYVIHEGQVLRIAPPLNPSNPALLQSARNKDQPDKRAPVTTSQRSNRKSEPQNQPKSLAENLGPVIWGWPTDGVLLRTFSAKKIDRKGVDIGGEPGASIRAAARGKVVYSGNGLSYYGNLLIIKHNESYLSAYAHNDKLLVKEGDLVRQGQPIATMGRSGSDRVMLHFEIRYNGKPVDPLRYLPRK